MADAVYTKLGNTAVLKIFSLKLFNSKRSRKPDEKYL